MENRYEKFDNLPGYGLCNPEMQLLTLCNTSDRGTEQYPYSNFYILIRNALEFADTESTSTFCSNALSVISSQIPKEAVDECNLPEQCERAEDGDPQAQYEVAMFLLAHSEYAANENAYAYLAASAEQGYPLAYFALAKDKFYTDPESAIEQLINAADCRITEAMDLLAQCYALGWGTEQNTAMAEKWFVNAAEAGDADRKLNLALRYRDGAGVSKSIGKAMSWVSKAQTAGNEDAVEAYSTKKVIPGELEQAFLSAKTYYNMIRGCGSDTAKEHIFMHLSSFAEYCDVSVIEHIGGYYFTANNVSESTRWYKMVEDVSVIAQVNLGVVCLLEQKDRTSAISLFGKAAEQDSATAMVNLGHIYSQGNIEEQDLEKAAFWYRQGAQRGFGEFTSAEFFRLAERYANGIGAEQDFEKAAIMYQESAEQGSADAQSVLGIYYLNGQGVDVDYEKAVFWLSKAAEQGVPAAQHNLAVCYHKGKGVRQNTDQALQLYRAAAKQGYTDSQFELGNIYFNGKLVKKDVCEAANWYLVASATGKAGADTYFNVCRQQMTKMRERQANKHRNKLRLIRVITFIVSSIVSFVTLNYDNSGAVLFIFWLVMIISGIVANKSGIVTQREMNMNILAPAMCANIAFSIIWKLFFA